MSDAIQKAIGVVKNWASGQGHVDANTRAAAAKAVAEWEKLKAENRAKGAVKESWLEELDGYAVTFADRRLVEQAAMAGILALEEQFGLDGLTRLLAAGPLLEASSWSPTLKRVATAPQELERHEVYDGAQHVGTIAARKGYDGKPNRWTAFAINGQQVTDYNTTSKPDALKAIQSHLEEAPARVVAMPTMGKYFVASPSSYSGETTYKAFPTEQAARHAAGLPAAPTVPEANTKVASVAEGLRFDLMTVSGMDIVPLRRAQEARRLDPFDLVAEAFDPGEIRDFRGRWEGGGAHRFRLSPSMVVPGKQANRMGSPADRRYGGGVGRMSAHTRSRLSRVFTSRETATAEHKPQQPSRSLEDLYKVAPERQKQFEAILGRVEKALGAKHHSTASSEDFRRAQGAIAGATHESHVVVGGLKTRGRAEEKVREKYAGDARRLTDMVRGTVLVPHVDDLAGAIEAVRASLPIGWTITNPENRFVHESGSKVHTGALGSGYRDVAVLLRSPDGFHAELQINTTHMWVAKEVSGGHALYEQRRVIAEQANSRKLTDGERLRVQRLDAKARELYEPALRRSVRAIAISRNLSRRSR